VKANKLVPKGERVGADQKLMMPPACEMETAVYGQCMANLLDSEVRKRSHLENTSDSMSKDVASSLDLNKCKFTLAAFDRCMKSNETAESQLIDNPQTTTYHSPTYYWMSSIYWQAPAKKSPNE